MRVHRALGTLAAATAMIAGAVLMTPGIAGANPKPPPSQSNGHANGHGGPTGNPNPYPPPPPSATVNDSTVKVGKSVRLTVINFGKNERVRITVRYRITLRHGTKIITVSAGSGTTDRKGRLQTKVYLVKEGYATITATSVKTGKSASVTVRVLDWHHDWPWWWHNAGYDSGASQLKLVPASNMPTNNVDPEAQVLVALVGMVGLAGSAIVGRRSARRRRVAMIA
jgi:hypothetical protein